MPLFKKPFIYILITVGPAVIAYLTLFTDSHEREVIETNAMIAGIEQTLNSYTWKNAFDGKGVLLRSVFPIVDDIHKKISLGHCPGSSCLEIEIVKLYRTKETEDGEFKEGTLVLDIEITGGATIPNAKTYQQRGHTYGANSGEVSALFDRFLTHKIDRTKIILPRLFSMGIFETISSSFTYRTDSNDIVISILNRTGNTTEIEILIKEPTIFTDEYIGSARHSMRTPKMMDKGDQ